MRLQSGRCLHEEYSGSLKTYSDRAGTYGYPLVPSSQPHVPLSIASSASSRGNVRVKPFIEASQLSKKMLIDKNKTIVRDKTERWFLFWVYVY